MGAALKVPAHSFPDQEDLATHSVPLKSIFRVTQETVLDLELRPVIVTLDGEEHDQPVEAQTLTLVSRSPAAMAFM